jgi:endonuclease YncB( thermonuclease family)
VSRAVVRIVIRVNGPARADDGVAVKWLNGPPGLRARPVSRRRPYARVSAAPSVYRVDRVIEGGTIALRNGQRVRLVQIDTPEVYFGVECYGRQASARAKALLPPGTRCQPVRRTGDRVDDFGRLLCYVVRVFDGLNVNTRLVVVGP